MENKKHTGLDEELKFDNSDFDLIVGFAIVAGIFGNWGKDKKYEELEKRISKLETKNEIIEKILF